PGFESRHNTLYWRGHDYAAAGCGAHGYRRTRPGGTRYGNPRKPEAYLEAVERGGVIEAERESISSAQLFEERLFLGLRLASGLDLEAAARDTVGEIPASTLSALPPLERMGLVEREGSHIRCTESGLDFHTEVAVRLLPASPA